MRASGAAWRWRQGAALLVPLGIFAAAALPFSAFLSGHPFRIRYEVPLLVASALAQWVKHAQADRSKGRTGLTTTERDELARLRRENRILQEEREILKNESRALRRPDLWARNSVTYARTPGAVAVCFLVTSRAR